LLRDWQSWRPIDHTTVTFGQGVSTTTLQLAVAYSVLTNDGVLIAPRLIEGTPAQMTRRVLSVQAAQTTRAMLKNVVEEGLPHTAVIPGYCIGGKTGTAQVAINGRYSSDVFGALFAGFFPCDKPRVTMVVEVYYPKKQIHGSQVAAPTFRRIAEEILAHWGVMPRAVKEPTR
jgi:cell division protein FtsI (penicillin-binding protein 3)